MDCKKRIEEYVKRFDVEGFDIVKDIIEKIFLPPSTVGEDSYKEIFIITLAKWSWIIREFIAGSQAGDPHRKGLCRGVLSHGDTCGLCIAFVLYNKTRTNKCMGCPLDDKFDLDLDDDQLPDCCFEFEDYINDPSKELAIKMYKRIEKEFFYRFPAEKLV